MSDGEEKASAVSKVVLLLAAVLGVISVVWLAWFHPLPIKVTVTSFEECVKAGNPVTESYPETCTTEDKQQFVNKSQRQYLIIKEWGVRLPYPVKVRSLSYSLKAEEPDVAHIKLDDVPGSCKGVNQLRRALSGQNIDGLGSTPEMFLQSAEPNLIKKIGDYYYMFSKGDGSCTKEGQDRLQDQINTLSTGLTGTEIQKLEVTP